MREKIVYIGTPDSDAGQFEALARADFPQLELLATNDRAHAMEHLQDAEAIISLGYQFNNEMLRRASRLRWIQSLTTGTDSILKLAALKKEVIVTSTRGMHAPQMSELVFLAMLSLQRDFPHMLRNQSKNLWQRWPQPLLSGKTVVIVGVGAIAEVLAPRCKAFGMSVCGVSSAHRLTAGFDRMFGRDELPAAAATADFLVLLLPYSPQTENLIDASVLAAMKPSAFLINVARGGVLDDAALLEALRTRRIAGAFLDVFKQEPLPAEHAFWQQDHLILTPHIGGMSDVYLEQAYPLVRDNLRLFLADRLGNLHNVVEH